MPAEKSLYRKIQETLDTSKAVNVSSLQELREAIESRRHHVFQTPQYDPGKDSVRPRVSVRVIRQTVQLCFILGLLDSEGGLTEPGRDALRKNQFDETVGQRVIALFKERGIKLAALNQIIVRSLESRPPVLPTAAELWGASPNDIPRGRFNKLLTLLSHCGYARYSQKKLYLHIGR